MPVLASSIASHWCEPAYSEAYSEACLWLSLALGCTSPQLSSVLSSSGVGGMNWAAQWLLAVAINATSLMTGVVCC